MPNWCYNKVLIRGDRVEDVTAFITAKTRATGANFSFEWIVPSPAQAHAPQDAQPCPTVDDLRLTETAEDLRNVLAKMQLPTESAEFDWYHWNINNWGTKWDADHPQIEVDPTEIPHKAVVLRFDTAWAPALLVTQAFSIMFPTAVFEHTYAEPGCNFSGSAIYENGDLVEHVEGEFMDSEWHDPDYEEY